MKTIQIITAIALLLCLAPMPYGYYIFIRFGAMVAFAVMAYFYWQKGEKPISVAFGALALLFQPFCKVALGRAMWNIVDVAIAILLIVLIIKADKDSSC